MGVGAQGPLFWIGGRRCAELPLPDRAVWYGDGLFETLRWQNGVLQFAQLHWQRLQAGCHVLGIPPPSLAQIADDLVPVKAELSRLGVPAAAVRYTLHRAGQRRGYRPELDAGVLAVVSADPIALLSSSGSPPAQLALAEFRYAVQPRLAQIKHSNRLEQVMAAAEIPADCDDVVVRDTDDWVIGCSAANILWRKGSAVMVPQVDRCGIAGTVRQWLLEEAFSRLRLSVQLGRFSLQDLLAADEVWITSSLRGVQSVAALHDRYWSEFAVADQLRSLWHSDAEVGCVV